MNPLEILWSAAYAQFHDRGSIPGEIWQAQAMAQQNGWKMRTHHFAEKPSKPAPKVMHSTSKLTEADIVEIRSMHARGVSQSRIAKRYGVIHPATLSKIILRKTWKHIP